MAVRQILGSLQQVTDGSGKPLVGGKIDIWAAGTQDRIISYTDSALTSTNNNPVVLDSTGRGIIWLDRDADIRITTSGDALVDSESSVNPDTVLDTVSGLVRNGSFELDADSNTVPDNWTNDVNYAGSSNAIDTSQSSSGSQSWRTQSTGSGGGQLVSDGFFEVSPEVNLAVSFDLFSTVATVRNIVRLEWYDSSQAFLSNTDLYDSTSNPATFTRQSFAVTPVANARFAKLRIFGGEPPGTATGITYWDNFSVLADIENTAALVAAVRVSSGDVQFFKDNVHYASLIRSGVDTTLISEINSNVLELRGRGAGGSSELLFKGVPEGTFNLYHNSNLTLYSASGEIIIGSDIATADPPTTEAVTAAVRLENAISDPDVELGTVGFRGSNELLLRNSMVGGLLTLSTTHTGEVNHKALQATPNGAVELYFGETKRAETANHTAGSRTSGMRVVDAGGTLRNVGFNELPVEELSAAFTFTRARVGSLIRWTSGTANGTIPNSGDTEANETPIGSFWYIAIETGTGVLTVAQGTGNTLRHMNTTGASGNLALAAWSVYKLIKVTATVFYVPRIS